MLRIEDLDGPRVKLGAAQQAIDLLEWLGLDWDLGPMYQSHDLAPYREALHRLAATGEAYACNCTRSEIEAASLSAPHEGDYELCYPGTCRPAVPTPVAAEHVDAEGTGWRLRTPAGLHRFRDQFVGDQAIDLSQTVGDFQVWTKAGLPSYQLAVVVDDARQAVDRIVRGDDLLTSTPRQRLIAQRLGLEPAPQYWHLPLVRGEDGKRLAKRHGDTRLVRYRQAGVTAEQVVGLLAEWCGLGPREPMTAMQFADQFSIEKLPRHDVVFHAADEAWLLRK